MHIYAGKQAHICKALTTQEAYVCRFRRIRLKDICLTGGDPGIDSYSISREVSRSHSRHAWYEPKDKLRKSGELNYSGYPTPEMQTEGPNIRLSQIRQGGSNLEFASLVLNQDKGAIGVKSDSADT